MQPSVVASEPYIANFCFSRRAVKGDGRLRPMEVAWEGVRAARPPEREPEREEEEEGEEEEDEDEDEDDC